MGVGGGDGVGRGQAGFAQMTLKRMAFIEFIHAMAVASEPHAEEIRSKIYDKMDTLERFVQSFAKRSSTAAIGARAAEDELVDVEQVENEVCAQGVASATAEKFEEFREALTPTGKICADLFAQTHGGGFNVDFLEIANAEARSASFSFPWHDLFLGKAEEKVGGISVPLLHAACLKWIASTLSQPTTTNSTSAIGDADRALATATTQGADHAEEKARANTTAKLEEMLQNDDPRSANTQLRLLQRFTKLPRRKCAPAPTRKNALCS